MNREINLCDGKYSFKEGENGSELVCYRNNEPWREFIGDKAVHALFDLAWELNEQLNQCCCVTREHLGKDNL